MIKLQFYMKSLKRQFCWVLCIRNFKRDFYGKENNFQDLSWKLRVRIISRFHALAVVLSD